MSAFRFTVILLLLLNLLALAAIAGWLGTSPSRGEPERLSNQLHPERIMLLSDVETYLAEHRPAGLETPDNEQEAPRTPASPQSNGSSEDDTTAHAMICMRYPGVDAATSEAIERMANASPDAALTREPVDVATDWWVRIDPAPDRASAEQRSRQLRDKGVRDLYIVPDRGPDQHAISLGLFRTESRARQHLKALEAQGVTGAKVLPRNPLHFVIELTAAESLLQDVNAHLKAQDLEIIPQPCP